MPESRKPAARATDTTERAGCLVSPPAPPRGAARRLGSRAEYVALPARTADPTGAPDADARRPSASRRVASRLCVASRRRRRLVGFSRPRLASRTSLRYSARGVRCFPGRWCGAPGPGLGWFRSTLGRFRSLSRSGRGDAMA